MINRIDVNDIPVMPYSTEWYKIKRAFKHGQDNAMNHYFCEDFIKTKESELTSWLDVPYSDDRPSLQMAYAAGFYEKWSELKNME